MVAPGAATVPRDAAVSRPDSSAPCTVAGLDAEAATRLLIKRLLHGPSEALRAVAAGDAEAGRRLERTIESLFLDNDAAPLSEEEAGGENEP